MKLLWLTILSLASLHAQSALEHRDFYRWSVGAVTAANHEQQLAQNQMDMKKHNDEMTARSVDQALTKHQIDTTAKTAAMKGNSQ